MIRTPYKPKVFTNFIGRKYELDLIKNIQTKKKPSILIVHGRRRVGKTALIEHALKNRVILKFEGIEGEDKEYQIKKSLKILAGYTNDSLIADLNYTNWGDFFKILTRFTDTKQLVLYFEELQWLAIEEDKNSKKNQFISELKYYWDNYFSRNNDLIIVLCGSSPSFMIEKVILSKALYNRSEHELALKELSPQETALFFGDKYSKKEIMDSYLTVGGIPEYLNYLKMDSSPFLSLSKNSFREDGFFFKEEEKIFISTLAKNKFYKEIVKSLALNKYLTRDGLIKKIKGYSSGMLTEILADLELCNFIEKFTPYFSGKNSLISRYCIKDYFLQFYYKFIHPIEKEVKQGKFKLNTTSVINKQIYTQWLGYAFERYIRNNAHVIAKIMEFSGINYRSGAYYKRGDDAGCQIDLVFERDDRVNTICEIKYLNSLVDIDVIESFERKINTFNLKKNYRIQKVLITFFGATERLERRNYFDKIIKIEDLLNPARMNFN